MFSFLQEIKKSNSFCSNYQCVFFFFFLRSGVGAPNVGEMDGDYFYDSKKSVLEWQLAVIDTSNPSGSLEFKIPGAPDDFFPVNVSFYSTKTICDFQVCIKNFNKFCLKYKNIGSGKISFLGSVSEYASILWIYCLLATEK